MTAPNCPSRETLFGYLAGTIPEAAADKIAEHLNQCVQCEQLVQELETKGDTVMAALRQPVQRRAESEAASRLAVDRIRGMKIGGGEPAGSTSEPTPTAPPRRVPTLGDYELLKKLGQGGMGAVYKARHKKLKRIVALKVLPKNRLRNAEAVARFEREMEAVGRLDHPHIIRAMDAREVGGIHFLVMEYVEGLDLARIVHQCGALSIADACEVVRQAAMGLQCSHENGLVHRDIKPSNLMLTTAGDVKVLDLGLAQIHETDRSEGQITGTEQVMGTPDYMSPEQALGSHSVDIRTDIYSLGCTLYHLLAGRVPFSGPQYDSAMKKLLAHVHDEPPAIEFVRADVPKPVAALVERMLAKAPGDRLPSPAAVIDALSPFCEGSKLISLLREAQRKEQKTVKPEASRVETGELHASMEVETSPDVPAMSHGLEHADHGSEIDPYHVWLGIPPAEQPPDHYRLLGITPFETNAEVVHDAAARQMAHVRTYHLGRHAELSQKILNELAAAKACLLSPAKKTAYDARLREKQAANRSVLSDALPDLPDWLAADAQAAPPIPVARASFWSTRPPATYAIGAAGLGAFLVLMGIILSVSTAKGRVKIVLNDPQAEVEVKVDGEKIEIAGLDEPLVLRPGEHELTVTGPKYEAVGRSFTVRRGDNAVLEVTLVPISAALSTPKVQPHEPAAPESSPARTLITSVVESPPRQTQTPAVTYEQLAKGRWISLSDPPEELKRLRYQTGRVVVKDGIYDFDAGGIGYNVDLSDVAVRAKVKPLGSPATHGGASILLRAIGHQSDKLLMYSALFSPDGRTTIFAHTETGCALLGEADTGLKSDEFHEFLFCAIGDALTVFLDGKLALQAHHQAFHKGKMKIAADRQRVLFKDIELLDLSLTSQTPAMSSEGLDTISSSAGFPAERPGAPFPAIAPLDAATARKHQEDWAGHLGVPVEMTNSIGMKFALIPPGEFEMGSTEEEVARLVKETKLDKDHIERLLSEAPKHRVRITKPFWLSRHEVTRGMFRRFVEDRRYRTDGERDGKGGSGVIDGQWRRDPRFVWNADLGVEKSDDYPVVHVSWNDATAFCEWLSDEEGMAFRLPTEAQWEYACRAGTTTAWHSGDDEAALHEYTRVSASERIEHPVGQLRPNAWGLYDMHGNVFEWCHDWFAADYYAASPLEDPMGPGEGSLRVSRGGCSNSAGEQRRSAYRVMQPQPTRAYHLGFRVVGEIAAQPSAVGPSTTAATIPSPQPQPSPAAKPAPAPVAAADPPRKTSLKPATEANLGRRVSYQFDRTPLREACRQLAEQTGCHAWLDTRSLKLQGIAADMPVTAQGNSERLDEALDRMLLANNLTWTVQSEVILITTAKQAAAALETRVYRLVRPVASPSQLVSQISTMVAPTSWANVGGPASIETFPPAAVVIAQTQAAHRSILQQFGDMLRLPGSLGARRSKTRPSAAATGLAAPVACQFVEAPLTDVLKSLEAQCKVPIRLDEQRLSDVGLKADVPLTVSLDGIQLESALRLILSDLGLAWIADRSGLIITTAEAANRQLTAARYDVRDLTLAARGDTDALIEVITATIAPRSWANVGGPGLIQRGAAGELRINQSFHCHREIEALLVGLRAAAMK